jgi:hypothetical protein
MFDQVSADIEDADVNGTLTTGLTARTVSKLDQIMPVIHKTSFFEWFDSEERQAGAPEGFVRAEIIAQWAVKAARALILDIYGMSLAAAMKVTADHFYDTYVNSTNAGAQHKLTPDRLRASRTLMGDQAPNMNVLFLHSKMFADLEAASISTAYMVPNIMGEVFGLGLEAFKSVLGVRLIQDDQVPTAAGTTTSSPTKYRGLLLRSRNPALGIQAPIVVSEQQPFTVVDQHVLGMTGGPKRQIQIKWAYGCGFRGMSYIVASGANPAASVRNNKSNWANAYPDHKDVGIVALELNAT